MGSSPTRATMNIIGGLFPLPDWPLGHNKPPPFWHERKLLFASGRCGLWSLRRFTHYQIWLPTYCCNSMIDVLPGCKFYDVDSDLKARLPDDLGPNDLVVLINYFGIPHPQSLYKDIKRTGASILEDACWSFFTPPNPLADFVLYSPSKMLGVPDGGILLCRQPYCVGDLTPPPDEWWSIAYAARRMRRMCPDENGLWYPLYLHAKDAPAGLYSMSKLSQVMLEMFFCYDAMAAINRRNYAQLSEAFGTFRPPGDATPSGFPIRVGPRDALQKHMAAKKIFCPVLWPFERVPELSVDSYWLSQHLLVLPCDYRYTPADMDRVVAAVKEFK